MLKASERVIAALDLPTVEAARDLYHELRPLISFFKIGLELFCKEDVSAFVHEMKANGDRVFLDYKLSDIERTVEAAVKAIAQSGADAVTVHADPPALRGAAAGAEGSTLKVWAVTMLSSLEDSDVAGLGASFDPLQYVQSRTALTLKAGCAGVIVSGPGLKAAKRAISESETPHKNFSLVVPGIRPAGVDWNDQKRVLTPKTAIMEGAEYLVVGRPIRNAPDRIKAAQTIIGEIESAFS